MKRVSQLCVLIALIALTMGTASATVLVSTVGVFSDAAQVFEQSFLYNPATMGGTLVIQTYGYGGSSNGPGGRNANGVLVAAGGFDPIVALYSGAAGAGGARINFNDDGTCGAGTGTADAGICFDSRLVFDNTLAAGTYTVALSAFSNFPPTTETGAYPGGGGFNGRTTAFAVDVVSSSIPEPMTSMLLGSGLVALGFLARRRRK